MYAILQIGAKQYRVTEGFYLDVDRLAKEEGKSISFDSVLLVSDGKEVKVGNPYIKGIKINAAIVKHFRAKKTISFKYERRKNKHTKSGQRRNLTRIKINKIELK